MASIGGLARQSSGPMAKKGQVGSYPTTWQSMMSNPGQKKIAEKNETDTGEKIEVSEFMVETNKPITEEDNFGDSPNENTILFEENEEEVIENDS